MLVVDATVAFDAAFDAIVFDRIGPMDPVGPPLLWSETAAALPQAAFRGWVGDDEASTALSLAFCLLRSSADPRNDCTWKPGIWPTDSAAPTMPSTSLLLVC
jgi:hypothetical protein